VYDPSLIGALIGILVLIILDCILGIVDAILYNEFTIEKLPQFIKTKITAYYLGMASIVIAAQFNFYELMQVSGVDIAMKTIAVTVIGTFALSLLNDIKDKIYSIWEITFSN
jgi:hypothetical protein